MKGTRPLNNNEIRKVADGFDGIFATRNRALFGLQIILGTLAYRSLKRTKLGIREQSALRRVGELLALMAAAIPTILMLVNNPTAKFLIATDPVPWIIAPVWSYAAYLILWMRPAITPESNYDNQ